MTAVLATPTRLDVERVRRDFPILDVIVNGRPLVYLDNAATSQKPRAVIEAISSYYSHENANIHRGVHWLSERATEAYETSRRKLSEFLGATRPEEIIFTGGTTAGINLVAQTFGRSSFRSGDQILVSGMEHHSNIVPWQILCQQTGAVLRVIPVDEQGELDLAEYSRLLNDRTRLVAVTHVSNVLGTVNPIRQIADLAHAAGALVLVDGAQSAAHLSVDVGQMGCDFFVCSGHKMLGPTGIGVLFGRLSLLESMPPYQTGGGMIESVSFERTTFASVPERFEAGTPAIAGAVGLAAAVDYLLSVGRETIHAHELSLLSRATDRLRESPGVRLIGAGSQCRASVVSFVVDGAHPHDVGTILDQDGIAVRAGHHCAQPLMKRFGIVGTVRASFSLYNTVNEVDALLAGLQKAREVFA
jgi:cysteine desulfurase/selenocysteine lyase